MIAVLEPSGDLMLYSGTVKVHVVMYIFLLLDPLPGIFLVLHVPYCLLKVAFLLG